MSGMNRRDALIRMGSGAAGLLWLSGARALRTSYLSRPGVNLEHKLANQYLLSALLSDKADLLEIPVRFFPISPERVKRTSIAEGLRSLIVIAGQRLKRRHTAASPTFGRAPQASDEVPTEVSRGPVQTRAERRRA